MGDFQKWGDLSNKGMILKWGGWYPFTNYDEHQHSSCSDNDSDTGTNESEADEVPQKKGNEKKIENGQQQNQNQNWKDFQLAMFWSKHQGHSSMPFLLKMI